MSLSNWILRLIAWDGLLPAFVWVIPYAVGMIFTNAPNLIEFVSVAVPIAAFFMRFHVGRRFILSNHCGNVMRTFQLGVFCMGILILVLIDTMMILAHTGPVVVGPATREDVMVMLVLFAIYFLSMAFSMYPGFENPVEKTIENDPWSNLDRRASNPWEES